MRLNAVAFPEGLQRINTPSAAESWSDRRQLP